MQAKPILAMVLMQFGYAGLNIIAKYALDAGMNNYTFIVYRHAIAAAAMAPFAIVLERFSSHPSLYLSYLNIGERN